MKAPQRLQAGAAAVSVRDLVKRFPSPTGGALTAVDHVSFDVHEGEVFGFLGPNGAGKTTTLEIIEGLQEPSEGTTLVFGADSHSQRDAVKQRIGVQLQSGAYFSFLTLEEILDLFGSFYSKSVPAVELLEKVGLSEKRGAQVQELSGGQAQRFSIVAAMVNDPDILFLDEPTTGLDPQARRNLWDLVTYINEEEGKTVVLTTHYMEEAQQLCDRVAIIDNGRIQALDTPMGLIDTLPTAYRIAFTSSIPIPSATLQELPGVASVHTSRNGAHDYELDVADAGPVVTRLARWSENSDTQLEHLRILPATLEDVFLSITGRSLRD